MRSAPPDDAPLVSVVIPVRDRCDLLSQALDALDAQTLRDFEVIVVDDGSSDGTLEMASNRCVAGRRVRCFRNPERGAVAARQFGCTQARAPLLAFTDSDCAPVGDWLALLVGAAERGADLVAGPTVPARVPRTLERTMSAGDEGGYPTCNVLYRRAYFERLGGFRPGIDAHGMAGEIGMWEDTLMAWRLRRAGAVAAFEPGAVVHHHVFPPDLPDVLRRNWMGGGLPALVREVPELRASMLRGRVFFGQRSRALIYVMAVGVMLRRPRVAMAALACWTALRLKGEHRAGTALVVAARSLSGELTKDVVFTASLMRSSVKARTIVL